MNTTLGLFQRLFFLWRWASRWGTSGSVEWTTIYMQSYITDLWRRLGVIYRQSNSSERVVDYFEATVDRFRGTGKPNFRKFRFELMLR